jgi:hypothetical protein
VKVLFLSSVCRRSSPSAAVSYVWPQGAILQVSLLSLAHSSLQVSIADDNILIVTCDHRGLPTQQKLRLISAYSYFSILIAGGSSMEWLCNFIELAIGFR